MSLQAECDEHRNSSNTKAREVEGESELRHNQPQGQQLDVYEELWKAQTQESPDSFAASSTAHPRVMPPDCSLAHRALERVPGMGLKLRAPSFRLFVSDTKSRILNRK